MSVLPPRPPGAGPVPGSGPLSAPLDDIWTILASSGRMGTWQRDLRTGAAWWDAGMYAIYRMDPAGGVPGIDSMIRRIHPEDRDAFTQDYYGSLRRAGFHQVRFRLIRDDDSVLVVQGVWQVHNGPDGLPASLVGLVIDDTESIEAANRRLSPSLQLALVAGLLGAIHWRTDLTTQRVSSNVMGFHRLGLVHQPEGLPVDAVERMIHPDDLGKLRNAIRHTLETAAPADVEIRFRLPDGSYKSLLMRSAAERDASGRPVAVNGIALDITEQVAARRRERQFESTLAIVAEATGLCIWSTDAASGIVQWNSPMQRLFRAHADRLPRAVALEIVSVRTHPDDLPKLVNLFGQRDGAAEETELRVLDPQDELRTLICRSRWQDGDDVRQASGVLIDVTERRHNEEVTRLAEQRAHLATWATGVGVFERELGTGLSSWDEQMYRLRGLSPDDPRSTLELRRLITHPDDLPALQRLEEEVGATDMGDYRVEWRTRWPDGSEHWIASRGHVFRDSAGRAKRVIGVNWDITASKQNEQMRHERSIAIAANRARSLFLSRMSHELRTPLSAVLGYAQLMEADARHPFDPTQRERLALIQEAGRHLLGLINDTLDLASIDAGMLPVASEPVDLSIAAGQAIRLVSPQATRAGVQLDPLPPSGWVRADPRRLCQVLTNLLNLSLGSCRTHDRISLRSNEDETGSRIVITVTDTGRGLSDAQISRLFEPVDSSDLDPEDVPSAELGLALVQQLVQRMAGRLEVSSHPASGTRVALSLPAAEPPAAGEPGPAAPVMAPLVPAAARDLCDVIHVDDDAVHRLLVREMVALRPGLRLHSVSDGAACLALARQLRPALILLDLQLPDGSGFGVMQHLQQTPGLADTPVIAFSANSSSLMADRTRRAGFADYWEKPIDPRRFLAALDEWLARTRAGDPAT